MNSVTKEYDEWFQKYATQWLLEWDWVWLKAQGYAESLLNPKAESSVGAKGIMQIMDETWYDIKGRLQTIIPLTANVFEPQWNIAGGVYYMALMRNGWAAPRFEEDRRKLAQASYNAGFGHILKAQEKAGGVNDYDSIIAKLPMVTGTENAMQTTNYVHHIQQYYNQFKGTIN
jgi:membrane-bound lytic murein transglycosylase MltF